ncbi:hypothetical protein MAUB1S_11417 [Mycolicibacterium aubagnense]
MTHPDQIDTPPPSEPTLTELERALDHAETEYICADFIDNTGRRDAERTRWADRRRQLQERVSAARNAAAGELAEEVARFIDEHQLLDITKNSDELCIALCPAFPKALRGDVMAALQIIIDRDKRTATEALARRQKAGSEPSC